MLTFSDSVTADYLHVVFVSPLEPVRSNACNNNVWKRTSFTSEFLEKLWLEGLIADSQAAIKNALSYQHVN